MKLPTDKGFPKMAGDRLWLHKDAFPFPRDSIGPLSTIYLHVHTLSIPPYRHYDLRKAAAWHGKD